MSSDRRTVYGKRLAALALVIAAGLLSSCQVKPLYSQAGGTVEAMKSVGFADARDRVSQVVRNRLVYLAGGGAGEAANPDYEVKLDVKSRAIGVLIDATSDTARAGRVIVDASYTLSRAKSGEIVKAGHRSAIALVDYSAQEFAKIRAIRDAEDRAANEVAEFIHMDIASALVH